MTVANLFVSPTGNDSNSGATLSTAKRTLAAALTAAQAGQIIGVAPGTYTGDFTTTKGGSAAAGYITLRSETKHAAAIVGGCLIKHGYFTLQGFEITGASVTYACDVTANNVTILNNKIHGIAKSTPTSDGASAIEAYSADGAYSAMSNILIDGNEVFDIGLAPGNNQLQQGIYLSTAVTNGRVVNNLVYDVCDYGIHSFHSPAGYVVANNTVVGCGRGILTGTSFIVRNNISYNNSSANYTIGTSNTVSNNISGGTGNVTGTGITAGTNPLFVNANVTGTGDFRLQPTSPALNAGTTSSAPTTDIVGTTRPQGTAVDLGCYEAPSGSGSATTARPLIGWGGIDFTGAPNNELRGAFMGRTSWTNLANGDYLFDPATGLSGYKTANPNGATAIGVPLIPHDSVASTGWNALLDEAIAGTRDSTYVSMGQKLAQASPKTVYARVWWEFNSENEGDINTTKFKNAWARAIPLIRSGFAGAATSGQTLKIVFCSMPDRTTKEAFYPGSAYVDIVSYDVYGKTYNTVNQTKAVVLAEVQGYLSDLATWGRGLGKPVALDEWGNWKVRAADGVADSRGFADWPEYITAVFDWATNTANNVNHLCYFNDSGGGVGITLNDTPLSRAVFIDRATAIQTPTGGGGSGGSTTPAGTVLSTTDTLSWTPTATGTYTLRYSATNSAGTGTDDITVVVGTGGGSATSASFVGVSPAASGESTGVTIAAVPGTQAGDQELAVIISAGAETMTSAPSGWALVKQLDVVSGTGDPGGPCTAWLYLATSTGTGAAVAWTKSGARVWHGVRAAYRGQAAVGATAWTTESSASTSHPTPAVTPTRANARVIGVAAADYLNATVGPFTAPAGWTERYDATITSGTENESIVIADIAVGASSTTGTFTSALADQAGVFSVVLEGPLVEQVVVLSGIEPRTALGDLTVSTAGPAQTVTLPSLLSPMQLGRWTVTVAAGPITIQLRGIPPRG